MNREEIFQVWADDSVWSPWIKPVLFAHLMSANTFDEGPGASEEPSPPDLGRVPRATGATAIIVDLPGASSIVTGLALADMGYRPIPLYNSVPGPRAAIDMDPIAQLLLEGAQRESLKRLSPQAPPAFLLDSRRRGVGVLLRPKDFDNRSISLPTDFPSSNFLLANRIRDVVVLQEKAGIPERDVAHTLRRWQDAGIRIMTATPGAPPEAVDVPRPPRFRHMWYGFLARLGLRRNALGGYGGFLPVHSAG